MTGHFVVRYFDPRLTSRNVDSETVSASDAAQAIKKADRKKALKRYRVESVECLSMVEE